MALYVMNEWQENIFGQLLKLRRKEAEAALLLHPHEEGKEATEAFYFHSTPSTNVSTSLTKETIPKPTLDIHNDLSRLTHTIPPKDLPLNLEAFAVQMTCYKGGSEHVFTSEEIKAYIEVYDKKKGQEKDEWEEFVKGRSLEGMENGVNKRLTMMQKKKDVEQVRRLRNKERDQKKKMEKEKKARRERGEEMDSEVEKVIDDEESHEKSGIKDGNGSEEENDSDEDYGKEKKGRRTNKKRKAGDKMVKGAAKRQRVAASRAPGGAARKATKRLKRSQKVLVVVLPVRWKGD